MKKPINRNHTFLPAGASLLALLTAISLSIQSPQIALAADETALKADVPTLDTSRTSPATDLSGAAAAGDTAGGEAPVRSSRRLTGGVRTLDSRWDTAGRTFHDVESAGAQAEGQSGPIQATVTDRNGPAFKLALQKLSDREALTADDFRSLGIGILGYEANRSFFNSEAFITYLVPGCPAAEAGIRIGDLEIKRDDPDGQKDVHGLTMFICGMAGKPVDLTIKRNGRKMVFHLVRMNVEDIPDSNLRHHYEHMIVRMAAKLAQAYPQLNPKVLNDYATNSGAAQPLPDN